jgi:hypothetical protein
MALAFQWKAVANFGLLLPFCCNQCLLFKAQAHTFKIAKTFSYMQKLLYKMQGASLQIM